MELNETDKKILEPEWKELLDKLNKRFNADLDLNGVLFLIGLQETGLGYRMYKKEEKLDIFHVAICTLLSPYGYYEPEGRDSDGWPHFKAKKKLPHLTPAEQVELLKRAALNYFKNEIGF